MIRIFDNALDGNKIADILTAIAGTWGATDLDDDGVDIAIGNITVGFRYNTRNISAYPTVTMAIISYVDGTSDIKTISNDLTLLREASMIILITRNLT